MQPSLSFRAGVAVLDITPPAGLALTGYILRDGPATGVHDSLFARALLLDDGRQQAAIVTCDVLGLDKTFVAAARQAIQAATGIPAAHTLIAASHTHAGPATMTLQDCGDVDPAWMARLRDQLVTVVTTAQANLQPAVFAYGAGQVTAGVHNRRTPGDVIDPQLGVLRVTNAVGEPLALLLNYACHPTCLTHDNRLYSAEYPGVTIAAVERAIGAPTLFVTGAIGDVGPVARGFDVMESIGNALATEALHKLANLTPLEPAGLTIATQQLELPLLALPSEEALVALVEENRQLLATAEASESAPPIPVDGRATLPVGAVRVRRAMLHWSERMLAALRAGQLAPTVETEVQVIDLGPVAFVSAPGELFVELGLAVKQNPNGKQIFLCGFGNDNIGYIPARRAYPFGGYEILDAYKYYGYPAALAPEAGELYVATARQLLG